MIPDLKKMPGKTGYLSSALRIAANLLIGRYLNLPCPLLIPGVSWFSLGYFANAIPGRCKTVRFPGVCHCLFESSFLDAHFRSRMYISQLRSRHNALTKHRTTDMCFFLCAIFPRNFIRIILIFIYLSGGI